MDPREHWQAVYESKAPDKVSWYQREPRLSLALIVQAAPSRSSRILDVGGGASTLVDALLDNGYTCVTVLDLSAAALKRSRERLGPAAQRVTWQAADILDTDLPGASVDLWHDRAVFHFLTSAGDRERYLSCLKHALRPGGHVVVATFAEDGPSRCSGLPVVRYAPAELHATFGRGFVLEATAREDHVTPGGGHQPFTFCLFRWDPASS